MKLLISATCMAVAFLAGCASSEAKLSSTLGPRPGANTTAESTGTLQVFTAYRKIASEVNFKEFFTGEKALREFDEPAHTWMGVGHQA